VQETGRRWGHAARQAGRALESRIHAVCDRAEWIAIQTREVFGADATLLTDYHHVSEYLAAAASACRPAQPEQWRRTQPKRLKRAAGTQVIAELAAHREAPQVPDENAPVRAAHRSLSNRSDTLDYAAALAAGLPIGSGLIESGHQHVLQARLKLPGCAWLPPNAESIPNSASSVPMIAGANSGPSPPEFLDSVLISPCRSSAKSAAKPA
jgi:hypothetical protein